MKPAFADCMASPRFALRVSWPIYAFDQPSHAFGAMDERSDVWGVPRNGGFGDLEHLAPTEAICLPFPCTLLAGIIRALTLRARSTLVMLHSFTSAWFREWRASETAMVRNIDACLSTAAVHAAPHLGYLKAEQNAAYSSTRVHPYAGLHDTPYDLPNMMQANRNSLISTLDAEIRMAVALAGVPTETLAIRAAASAGAV